MKEATGEANMTVITIVLIGVVAAVGIVLIPRISAILMYRGCCTDAGGVWEDGHCTANSCDENNAVFTDFSWCLSSSGYSVSSKNYQAPICTN